MKHTCLKCFLLLTLLCAACCGNRPLLYNQEYEIAGKHDHKEPFKTRLVFSDSAYAHVYSHFSDVLVKWVRTRNMIEISAAFSEDTIPVINCLVDCKQDSTIMFKTAYTGLGYPEFYNEKGAVVSPVCLDVQKSIFRYAPEIKYFAFCTGRAKTAKSLLPCSAGATIEMNIFYPEHPDRYLFHLDKKIVLRDNRL